MDNKVNDILFIRKYPGSLNKGISFLKKMQSIISRSGASYFYNGHTIYFLFVGYGKMQKTLHPRLIDKINSGEISDIVDIGAGGALDPNLIKGDLVLSDNDYLIDTGSLPFIRRRSPVKKIVKKLAQENKRRFFEGKILTAGHIIASREERLRLYKETGCLLVQMEHGWFLKSLQKIIQPAVFKRLYVTHLEIVADCVGRNNSFKHSVKELLNGINYCILHNEKYIGLIKSEFIRLWLLNG